MRARLCVSFLLTILIGTLGASQVASAATNDCTAAITDQTVSSSLNVPGGATCSLRHSTVLGSVNVAPGGFLVMSRGADVVGNVAADLASVQINASRVRGQLVISRALPVPVASIPNAYFVEFRLCGSRVDQGLTVQNAPATTRPARFMDIGGTTLSSACPGNVIGGPLYNVNNVTSRQMLTNNTVGGQLVCQGNTPAPITGGNVAAGGAFGQCAQPSRSSAGQLDTAGAVVVT